MRSLLASFVLCLATNANAVVRTVMEGTQATNNAIFVSTGPAANPSSIYVMTAGSMTVAKAEGIAGHLVVGSLLQNTTIQLDVVGLIRTSSGIVTQGGNARGANANDLQLTRTLNTQIALGASSAISGGGSNTAAGSFCSVGGGSGNSCVAAATNGHIGGGLNNTVNGGNGTVGGGTTNTCGANSTGCTIAGGSTNSIDDVSDPTIPSTIGGGINNNATNGSTIAGGKLNSAGLQGFIGGGQSNTTGGLSSGGAIGGGLSNTASGVYSFVGAGDNNLATGNYSAIPGGHNNQAGGQYSLSMGRRAIGTGQGGFTFSDSLDADFANSSTDTWRSRFGGGYAFTGGASTFSAVATSTTGPNYAVMASTSIKFAQGLTGIGILWSDGTTSTSAAGGASAAVNLTGPVTSVGAATTIVGPVPTGAVDSSSITTKFDAVGASTLAITNIQTVVGASTFTLSASTFALSASTANLFNIKGSTGVNGDISKMTALATITTALTITSTVTLAATGNGTYSLGLSSGMRFTTALTGIAWQDGSVTTSATSGSVGPAGPASSVTVSFIVDNFLSQVTGSAKSFTLTQAPVNSSATMVVLDGLLQSPTSDYTLSGAVITMTTAPASGSSSFYVQYAVYTTTLPSIVLYSNVEHMISSAAMTASSVGVFFSSANSTGGNVIIVASHTYELRVYVVQNTSSGGALIRLSTQTTVDSLAHYSWGVSGTMEASSYSRDSITNGTATSMSAFVAAGLSNTATPFNSTYYKIAFWTQPGDTNQVTLEGITRCSAESHFWNGGFSGRWIGNGAQGLFNGISIYPSAGTWTGRVELWDLGY